MTNSRQMLAAVGALCLAIALAPRMAAGQVTLAGLDDFVRAEMARQRIPGIAIAVVKNGEVVKAAGYGVANVEHGVPVTPETIFQSGSLGKQLTATAVMVLVEEGHIDLSDPITRFFPDAPQTWGAITVRHLLTHTSGIPDYAPGTLDYRRDYSEDELLRFAFGLPLEFPAGARWNYSNTGYVLLGILIRKASGRFYGDVLRERVFVPLGMETARIISEEDIVPNRAAGYGLVAGELKNQQWVAPQLNTTADGSLYLSLLDLVAWDRGSRTHAVLTPQSWAEVFQPARLSSGRTYPYGFGWQLAEIAGQKVVRHGGSWQGFKSHLSRYLGDDLTVIVLANLAQAELERFVDGIAAMINPRLAAAERTSIPDREPQVTARLTQLLVATSEGRLAPDEFAYVRAGFFPAVAARYMDLLQGLGVPQSVVLVDRRELGDDRIYVYEALYRGNRAFRVSLGLAPDDRISAFSIRPR